MQTTIKVPLTRVYRSDEQSRIIESQFYLIIGQSFELYHLEQSHVFGPATHTVISCSYGEFTVKGAIDYVEESINSAMADLKTAYINGK